MTAKTFNVGEVLSAADVNEYLNAGYWRRIGRSIVSSGSPVTSVTFSSINSTYRMFRITFSIQCSADVPRLLVNNDTSTSNYASQRVSFHTSTVSSDSVTSLGFHQLYTFGSGASTSHGEVFISKPNTGNRAVFHGQTSVYNAAFSPSQSMYLHSGNWNNTSVLINRLDVLVGSGNFYGVVALDGSAGV